TAALPSWASSLAFPGSSVVGSSGSVVGCRMPVGTVNPLLRSAMVEDLLRQCQVSRGSRALGSIGQDRFVARGGFLELDVPGNLGLEHKIFEEVPELALEVPAHVVLFHHRQEDAGDPERPVIEEPPDLGNVRLELAKPEDTEEARSDWDDDLLHEGQDVRRQ